MIPAMQRGDPQWSELRAVGVGWWIRNINTLRKMVEKVPGQIQTNRYKIFFLYERLLMQEGNYFISCILLIG